MAAKKKSGQAPYFMIMERKASFVCRLPRPKGKDIVLKVKLDSDPTTKGIIEREVICLEVLKGLAVPKRVSLKKETVAKLVKSKNFLHLAMEYVPGKGCFGRAFPVPQALALWAFTVEQMCAFRRHKILYTDFKHNHLRVTDDLAQAKIVDFDACLMVEPKGLYPTDYLGHTPQLAAPEFHFEKYHTERIIVYQMGMFLGSLLMKYFHNSDLSPKSFSKVKALLTEAHVKEVYKIFEATLSKSPVDRPKDLEVLFAQIQNVTLPEATYDLWNKMRAPYQKELKKLKFKDPESPAASTKKHLKAA